MPLEEIHEVQKHTKVCPLLSAIARDYVTCIEDYCTWWSTIYGCRVVTQRAVRQRE